MLTVKQVMPHEIWLQNTIKKDDVTTCMTALASIYMYVSRILFLIVQTLDLRESQCSTEIQHYTVNIHVSSFRMQSLLAAAAAAAAAALIAAQWM